MLTCMCVYVLLCTSSWAQQSEILTKCVLLVNHCSNYSSTDNNDDIVVVEKKQHRMLTVQRKSPIRKLCSLSAEMQENSKGIVFPIANAKHINPLSEIMVCTEGAHLNNLEAARFVKPDIHEHEVAQLTKDAVSKPFWLHFASAKKPSYRRYGEELLPRFAECTQSKSLIARITHGEKAYLKEYPWMALLEYTNAKEKRHLCVGSLINHRYVITAAHCLESHLDLGLSSVRLGEWDTSTNPDCILNAYGEAFCAPKHIIVMIEHAVPHPLYKPNSKNSINDIGLLRLERNIRYNDFISPICLPRSAESNKITYDGTRMAVIGWGRDENSKENTIKMKASVVGVGAERCKRFYRRKYVTLTDSQICAVGDGGSDSCQGDSGGPLITTQTVKKSTTVYILAGIVSFGSKNCGLEDFPSVYTKVDKYTAWILHTIKP
ncbi:hypothetical protein GQX74_006766 [Glossina fuscipes]|nr:hypothetical protein GQX74_006766 [Glossina fuscipes]